MSKHTSTRRESRNGVSMARVARLPSGSLPLRRTWPISLCIGLAIGSIAVSADALAGGPTGGTVVGGNGSITQSGNETVINQISQKLALNWETFNLKANESVLFNQPGRSAVALNRILDQNPSQIFGKINSNGQVFLINTHGIIFGATAQMNVGGLMASTLDLTPKDFLAGNYSLNAVGGGAGIVNHGLIQAASGGSVALVGGSVANDGVILANYGSINLDGAEHAVLDFDGNGLINIQITGELKQRLDDREAAVSNKGTLQAEGGTVVLQASAAKDLFTNLVNNSGVIDASGISTDGGVVRLVASGGNTTNSGLINVSGVHGGKIQMLSDQDVLVTGGVLDASGTYGGGSVLVGGDQHGTNLAVQNAAHTLVDNGVSINASAIQAGDGGKVVVWSDHGTWYYGNILARGGTSAGNGGFVEVSGKDFLQFGGTADRRAPHGRAGMLLLDPTDLTISATGPSDVTCTLGDCSTNSATSTLTTAALEAALSGGDVNVDATAGTGTGTGTINWTDGSVDAGGHSLTLTADGAITFNGTLTNVADLTFVGGELSGSGNASGTGTISGLVSKTFALGGTTTGTAGGITFHDFTAADAATVTGAAGFNTSDNSSLGMKFANATSVTGTGAITGLGSTTFNLTGANLGTVGTTTFNGFDTADTTAVTGASGFDDSTKTSGGMAFANATSVGGSGIISNVAGSFADDTQKSTTSNIVYAWSGSVSGSGGNVTGVTGNFNIGSKVSTVSGLDYSGFNLTTVAGSGSSATIIGSNQTYHLTGANAGNNGTLSWTSFENLSDSGAGNFVFANGASVTGTLSASAGTLDYSAYTTAVNLGLGGTATGTGGWSGITTAKGGAASDTISGSNQTYNLVGLNAGNNGTVGWSSFENIADAGTGTITATGGQTYNLSGSNAGTIAGLLSGSYTGIGHLSDSGAGNFVFANGASATGTLSASAGTLDYSAYTTAVNVGLGGTATGTGGWSGITTAKGGAASDTISGSNQTYNLTGANAGNNGTVGWNSFENIADAGTGTITATGGQTYNLSGSNAGTIAGLLSGSYTGIGHLSDSGAGNFVFANGASATGTLSASAGTLDYSAYTTAVNVGLGGTATGTGGWSGITNVKGGAGSDTISGSNQTYNLTGANAGNSGTLSWTSFENLSDSTAGNFKFADGAGVSGTLAGGGAGTLDYSAYTTAVNVGLGGTATNTDGWSGISTTKGGSASDTISGSNQTYTLTGTNAGNNGTVGWTSFEKIADSGAGTLNGTGQTYALTGSNTGTVTTWLPGGFTGIGNIADTTGTVNFGTSGSVAGNVTAKTLDYSSYASAVTFNVQGNSAVGIGGTWSGVSTVTGSANTDTITGSSATYTLTGLNAGSNGAGLSWTSFENLADATGTVAFGAGSSLSGNATAKVLNYGAYGSPVTFDLSGGAHGTTGIGGTWSGVTSVTGSAASDAINGQSQTYTLTGANAGTNGTVAWTSFERIADSGVGTIGAANQSWALTGHNQGTVTALSGSFSGIGNLSDTGSGTFLMHSGVDGSLSGNLAAGTNGTLDYAGYTTPVNVNLSGAGTTGVGGSVSGVGAISANSDLGVSGTSGSSLSVATSGTGVTTTLGSLAVGSNLTIHASGAILQTGDGITVGGTTSIDSSGGAVALTNSGNDFVGAVTVAGQGIALVDKNNLAVASVTDSANGAVSLIAGGTLSLPTAGINAGTGDLTLASNGGALATVGTLSGGNVSLAGYSGLTLGGPVAATGTLALSSSQGAINQTAGTIAAGMLTGSSAGSAILLQANLVGTLGAFTTGGDFTFNNAQSLTVNNALSVNGGAGNLTLTTTGASSDLTLASNLTGNTVILGAGRNINQTGGGITATRLTGNSTGSTTLTGANLIGTLGDFSAAGFNLTNAQSLTVSGAVEGGASTTLTTTAGDLAINGALSGTTTTLISAGAITEGAGGNITANLLTGHSVGNATLDGNNHINILGSFSADFSLTNGQTLTVEGPLDGGPSVALTTTAGDLIINGAVSGVTTTLTSAGAISEGAGGSITAGTLTGSSVGNINLLGTNQVAALGAFTSGGDFAFNNARTLTVSNAPSANGGAGNLTLTTTGAGSDLVLASNLVGNTVTLGAGRNISQTAGAITATRLTGSSTGSTMLNGANRIGTLGNFTAASFALTNAQSLVVTGSVDGGANATLTTTTGDLAINGSVKGSTTTLVSAGTISEGAGGLLTAGTLTGSSAGSTTLNAANHVGTLGAFTTGGNFTFNNAQSLTVNNAPSANAGAGNLTLTTTGASSDLTLASNLTGNTVTLGAGRNINQTGGRITATTLTGNSTGSTTLTGANLIGTLGDFSAAGFNLTNAQSLTVSGAVEGGASTTLTTTAGDLAINGALSGIATALNSAGAITEGADGVITAATLSGNAVGPTVLGSEASPSKNMVDTLGNFTSLAGFSMTNDKTLTLASVAGSSFSVNAGTSPFYLSVTQGDLFQLGTTPVYDGVGVWGSTGRMGTGSKPIYVVGTGPQTIANVGVAPAYFYAVDSAGNLLPLSGGFAINVPTVSGAGSAQNGIHGDSYIDPSVITANYRSYGIVPSGVRLPPDQQSGCDPDQPDQAACQDPDALGMVMPWPNAPQ